MRIASTSAPLIFKRDLFIALFFGFIIATIVGTLSHEAGHYFVAKALGVPAAIHYASTSFADDTTAAFMDSTYKKYGPEIAERRPFPGRQRFDAIAQRHRQDGLRIITGGPLQTMLTGTLGFCLLIIYRQSFRRSNELNLRQWLIIFLTLFWSREPVNFAVQIGRRLFTGQWSYRMDEVSLARWLHLPHETIILPAAIAGVAVMAIVTFYFVPAVQRFTFITAAAAGGIVGYMFWEMLAGPYILP